MSLDPQTLNAVLSPAVVVAPPRKSRFGWAIAVAVLVVAGAGGAWAWEKGYRPDRLWREKGADLALLAVDEGSLAVFVTESGTMESARNTSIKCKVEALLGQVAGLGSTGKAGTTAGTTAGGSGQSGSGQSGSGQSGSGQAGSGQAGGAAPTTTKTKKSSTKKAGGSTSKSSGSGSASKSGASGSGSTANSGSGTGSSGSASGSGSSSSGSTSTSGSDGTSTSSKPTIRSFSYAVAKHTPLRGESKSKSASQTTTKKDASAQGGGGGGGGGGRGGRGGGGGGMGQEEKPGSTRIIEIKPDGTTVKAGEVVCELDSASFRDELQAQLIRHAQAKAWVEQAKAIYLVNQITYREYAEGIYPQDLQLVRQYIQSCETDYDRTRRNEEWSRETMGKGFRAAEQYKADLGDMNRAELALKEARGMEVRLVKFTGPRLMKSLEAKLKAIRADMLAQEAAFGLEDDRLRRINAMVDNCTIRSPGDGILVYANQSNPWSGQIQVQIQEGATVREGQTLFDLPDPKHMRVKVKINESKMSSIRTGQKAEIKIDAFPGRVLMGTVKEITPIPAPLGRFSDIRVYFANVDLDEGGFDGLLPGLTAEVTFLVESTRKATRIPIQSVRWIKDRSYAAIAARLGDETRWDWRPIKLGRINEAYGEVLEGLAPGEKVVARPEDLPPPPGEVDRPEPVQEVLPETATEPAANG